MAGILPGLLAILMYIATTQIVIKLRPELCPTGPRSPWSERIGSLKDIWATMLLFVIVVVAMYGGFVTVTEAAGVGAVGAMLIGIARGRLGPRRILQCLVEALQTSASIFVIAIGAYLFGYFLTVTQTTQKLTDFLVHLPVGPYGVLALILVVYLIMGALMDELAIILLTVPIIYPVIVALGFDPIWFGVIIVMVVTLGLILPPVGMNVFVINSISRDVSLGQIYRGVMPFIASDILRLVLLVMFPWISLAIPNSMN
jgi:tripartite ATP-independent transporter DctM subunit